MGNTIEIAKMSESKKTILELSKTILQKDVSEVLRMKSLKEILNLEESVFGLKERLVLIERLLRRELFHHSSYSEIKEIEIAIRQQQKSHISIMVENQIRSLQQSQESFNFTRFSEIEKQVDVFKEAEKLGSNAFKGAGRHSFFWTYVVIQKYLEVAGSDLERNRSSNNLFLKSLESLVSLKRWNKFELGSRRQKTANCMVYAAVFGIFNDVDFNYNACRAVLSFGNEMADNFEAKIKLTENYLAEYKSNQNQRMENLKIKKEADEKLREQFEKLRLDILKESPLGPYYGESFVNNRW